MGITTADMHKNQAIHNMKFLESINKDKYKDWAITVYFYCCVHMVEYFFIKELNQDEKKSNDHKIRNSIIRQESKCNAFCRDYDAIYTLSRMSRYKCIEISNKQVYEAQVCYENIKKCTFKI